MIISIIDFLKGRLRVVKICCFIAMLTLISWSVSLDTQHAHTWLEAHIPGFWTIFGLLACLVLIFVSRWFAKVGIRTREDYYDS